MIIKILITDDIDDEEIQSHADFDLDSGSITNVEYIDYDIKLEGHPSGLSSYQYTSGLIKNEGKELEFSINVEDDEYTVSKNELKEVKEKAAKLFSQNNVKNKRKI